MGRAAQRVAGAAGGAAAPAAAGRAPAPAAAAAAAPVVAVAAPVAAVGTGSCWARKLRLPLKDRFRDQTGRDHQGHNSLALQNRTFHLRLENTRSSSQ